MAKKLLPVTLWQAHVCECAKCEALILVQGGDPWENDKLTCTSCGTKMIVDAICSDCRNGDEPADLECRVV